MQLIVNGIDANRARQIQGYARGVLEAWTMARRARGERVALPADSVPTPRDRNSTISKTTEGLRRMRR